MNARIRGFWPKTLRRRGFEVMTKKRELDVICPYCKNRQKVSAWDSINVTLNPELRESLLNAELNLFECDGCGQDALLTIPLLYHDMKRQFCVQFFPFGDTQNGSGGLVQWFTEDGKLRIEGFPGMGIGKYIFEPHVVLSLNEMIRYVLFRENLYDRVSLKNGHSDCVWN
jgi:hypothetical protein